MTNDRGVKVFACVVLNALWVASTREVNPSPWSVSALGVLASEVVWDAVLAAHP